MDNPVISIVVPIYNVEKYIHRCVNSILNQTYRNIEVLLVDDGSPDNCGRICDEYAAGDSRVKVIHKTNGGLSDARNAGIKAATGEYIGFVDGDDYIAKDMYSVLLKAITDGHADVSLSNYSYVDEKYQAIAARDRVMPVKDEIISGNEVIRRTLMSEGWYYVTAWNKLYKRELFNGVRFPEGKLHEDEYIVHEIFSRAVRVACVSRVCYYYVQHAGSIMNRQYNIKHLDKIEAFSRRFEYCLSANMKSCAIEAAQRMYGSLLEAYTQLDMSSTAAKKQLTDKKRMYLGCCRKIKKELGFRKYFIDAVVFKFAPFVNIMVYKKNNNN